MDTLLPLKEVPTRGFTRELEAMRRREYTSRADALAAAEWRLELAPGCHGQAVAPVVGWVLTERAAKAVETDSLVHMPGGTSHERFRAVRVSP